MTEQINLLTCPIETRLSPFLVSAYLKAPVFSFDIETDAENYHWSSGDRGLAYPADIIMISFHADGLPTLVLMADKIADDVPYEAEVFDHVDFIYRVQDYQTIEKKHKNKPSTWVKKPLTKPVFEWSEENTRFIRSMFMREKYTAVAHNLVFDGRQIFGKFKIPIPDGAVLWDTQTIELTGGWLKPMGEDDYVGASLLALTQQMFTPESLVFFQTMKDFNTKLRDIIYYNPNNDKLPSYEAGVLYSASDSIAALALYKEQMAREWYTYPEGSPFENLDRLIEWETEYTKFCVESAVEGILLNVDYTRQMREEKHAEYMELIAHLGLDDSNEYLFRNADWIQGFVFSQIPAKPVGEDIQTYKLLTKNGAWSFGKDQIKYYIEKYGEGDDGPLSIFRAASEAANYVKTCNEWLRHAEFDGRIHSTLARITITSRNASSTPNVQNVDFHKSAGMLITESDRVLIELDYSNCENWTGAMYGKDNSFASICCETDFHDAMIPVWGLQDLERKKARLFSKRMTFGTSYGMGVTKLANSIGVSKAEAKRLLDEKDRQFAKTKLAKDKAAQFAEKYGYTQLWTGRRVNIKKFQGKYKGYTAWNSLSQGGVAEIVVRAIVRIRKWLRENGFKTRVATQIHDSLIIDLVVDEYYQVIPMIIEIMSTVVPPVWLNRTTPPIRFLTDVDHAANKEKWGYVPGREYPLDVMTYYNRWGEHRHGPDTWIEKDKIYKAPVWINEHGFGRQAVDKELGLESVEPGMETATPVLKLPEITDVDWLEFQNLIGLTNSTFTLLPYNGTLYGLAQKLQIERELCHRGQENRYLEYLETYGKLITFVETQLKPFVEGSGGKC